MDEEARAWPCVAKIGMNLRQSHWAIANKFAVGSRGDAFPRRREACQTRRDHVVRWEYRKIPLNEHPRSSDDIDVLYDAGEKQMGAGDDPAQ